MTMLVYGNVNLLWNDNLWTIDSGKFRRRWRRIPLHLGKGRGGIWWAQTKSANLQLSQITFKLHGSAQKISSCVGLDSSVRNDWKLGLRAHHSSRTEPHRMSHVSGQTETNLHASKRNQPAPFFWKGKLVQSKQKDLQMDSLWWDMQLPRSESGSILTSIRSSSHLLCMTCLFHLWNPS